MIIVGVGGGATKLKYSLVGVWHVQMVQREIGESYVLVVEMN